MYWVFEAKILVEWKRLVVKFVARCLVYQQIKAEHQRLGSLLKPLEIPIWRWEHITMDFVIGLPKSSHGN